MKWEQPIRFDSQKLPTFPINALPEHLAAFVDASAQSLQVPADMMAMLSLGALGVACGGRFKTSVVNGYNEPCNLFICTVAGPAERKSAGFNLALQPIKDYERKTAAEKRGEIAQKQAEYQALEKALQFAQNKASRVPLHEREYWLQQVRQHGERLDSFVVPASPLLMVDDTTGPRLAQILADNGSAAVCSSEGGVFASMGSEQVTDLYLKGHAGDPIRIERVTRSATYVDEPALTVVLTVQPHVLRGLAAKKEFRGKGLLARFCYSIPRSLMGRRKVCPSPVPHEITDAYNKTIQTILERQKARTTLTLSAEALEVWMRFCEHLEPRLGDRGDLAIIRDWGGKASGLVIRIASLLHVAKDTLHPNDISISAETISSAVRIVEYLTEHAKAAFSEMGADPIVDDAKYVLNWLSQNAEPRMSARDIFQGVKARLKRMDTLRKVLRVLAQHGYVRFAEQPKGSGRGRRPSPIYEVHPSLWETQNCEETDRSVPAFQPPKVCGELPPQATTHQEQLSWT